MVKDHLDSERGNTLLPHGLLFPINRHDNTYHGLCYTSRGALVGTRNSSMRSTMKDRSDDPSHHERTLLPCSCISLPGEYECNPHVTVSGEISRTAVFTIGLQHCIADLVKQCQVSVSVTFEHSPSVTPTSHELAKQWRNDTACRNSFPDLSTRHVLRVTRSYLLLCAAKITVFV